MVLTPPPPACGARRHHCSALRQEPAFAELRGDEAASGDLLLLRAALAKEREHARLLREALELAATYFHAPLDRPEDDHAWATIVQAIRSRSGCLSLGD